MNVDAPLRCTVGRFSRSALILCAALVLSASGASAAERILSYDSRVSVHPDGSLRVTETIAVRAEGNKIKRGIYRDFPTRYKDRLGNRVTVAFEVLEVLRDGKAEPWHTRREGEGERVYIGNKNVFLDPGEYTYTLSYRTDRQVGFFEDFDELYWNVTGNGWDFPIDAVSAEISLPVGARVLSRAAYTGPKGAQGKDFVVNLGGERMVRFTTTRPLGRQEGLTVAVSWPKGVVAEPTPGDRARSFFRDSTSGAIALAGLVLLLAYFSGVWLHVGRDPPSGSIVPQFEPPEGFSPAAVRYVMRMGYSNRVFAAAIVSMAVKGYHTIKKEGGTFTLQRHGVDTSMLTPGERKIAEKLYGSRSSIKLKQKNHTRIGAAVRELKKSLKADFEKLHFAVNAGWLGPGVLISALTLAVVAFTSPVKSEALFFTAWLTLWTVGTYGIVLKVARAWRRVFAAGGSAGGAMTAIAVFLSLFALPFVIPQIVVLGMFARKVSPVAAAVLVLIVGVNVVFSRILKAPTVQGRRVMDRIEGFRVYLEAAEKDRLDRLNPPEETPTLFEKYLPYALALGVENAWSEKFAGILAAHAAPGGEGGYRPGWYYGEGFHGFDAGTMVSDLGSSLSSAVATSSSAPGSSSGSGGGGSSGGGGGGGGGGGW
jgi:uncharacterized membrane protein YgcG